MAKFDAVFEGGGAKGTAFAGALEVLKNQGHQLSRLIGTSGGAITATLCAAGYGPGDMLQAVQEKENGKPRFASFMDIPSADEFTPEMRQNSVTMEVFRDVHPPLVPGFLERKLDDKLLDALLKNRIYARLFSFVECGGYYAGKKFLEWMREKLRDKGIQPEDTLKTMFEKTGSDLSLVVSDTTDMEMLVLNHRTAPTVPVANAVRMSMSIPFVWQEVVWKEEWGQYLGRRKAGNIIVDGGVLSNFPIRLIASSDPGVREIMGDTDPNAAGNLGLLIDETLPVPGAENTNKTPTGFTHLRTIQRVSRLVDTLTGASDNEMIRQHQKEICRLPAKGYGTLEFDMPDTRLKPFLQAARDAMTRHLASRGLAASAGNP